MCRHTHLHIPQGRSHMGHVSHLCDPISLAQGRYPMATTPVHRPPGPAPASPARVPLPSAAAAPGAPHSYQHPASDVLYLAKVEKNRPETVLLPCRLLPSKASTSTAFR